jgi:hypothetical protein
MLRMGGITADRSVKMMTPLQRRQKRETAPGSYVLPGAVSHQSLSLREGARTPSDDPTPPINPAPHARPP